GRAGDRYRHKLVHIIPGPAFLPSPAFLPNVLSLRISGRTTGPGVM
ncbi:unnamed protein product, partial [Plutella xylostella]